ncbi:hypothetical protein FVEG_04360 [Fusarium verticillioides 7600]|uniref:BZIP domain-containing protein n=1 Tax=Gibberella moniliformis (strain M3125 / FGSC 7600) TaxID=334819 RepID=W7MCN0_GIBM7|nr:hypothetical protein FVEG_04360 [Fusarium verticillioides 7600]EWG42597.1 hypothetical protein FVEG_04360 [Fusarium verticillioides 7600]
MEQCTGEHADQTLDMSTIGNLDDTSNLLGTPWFDASNDNNPQYALNESAEYLPRYLNDPTLVEWSEPLFSQLYATPQQDPSFTSVTTPSNSFEFNSESCVPQLRSESTNLPSAASTIEYHPESSQELNHSEITYVPSSPEDIEHYRPLPPQPEAKKRRVSSSVQSTMSLPDDILTASVQRESEARPPTKRRDTANKTDIPYLKKVRERNKRAATKVRLKQRETEKSLASAEKDLQEKNHRLTDCVKELTHQIHDLKMQLLQHGTCDCTLIQEYIGNEANRYVQETSG